VSKTMCSIFALAVTVVAPAFAVDGTTLINQATVMATGGFPYNISQSGSYRLSGNLIVPSTATGAIFVGAPSVTIDLNGFSITCPAANCTFGIQSNAVSTKIMNGTITGFIGSGVSAIYLAGPHPKVDNVTLYGNNTGILVTGRDATVTNCNVSNNVGDGINANPAGTNTTLTVLNSVISGNGLWGIEINNGLISGNTINGNNSAVTAGAIFFSGVTTMVLNNLITNTFGVQTLGYFGTARVVIGLNTIIPAAGMPSPEFTSMGNNVCAVGVSC
jgi:hypothetical protein